jgi:flavodoxin
MKIAVQYQSRGGNTKVVAEAIAEAATQVGHTDVTAEPIGATLDEAVDLLFIGGGVYAWGLDKEFTAYLETLSSENVKKIAAFTTAGGMDKTKSITEIAAKKGIAVTTVRLAVRFGLKNHTAFGESKEPVSLTDTQLAAVNEFVGKVISEYGE